MADMEDETDMAKVTRAQGAPDVPAAVPRKTARSCLKLPRFAEARARRLLKSPQELQRVIERARRKSARAAHSLGEAFADLKAMLHLVQAWLSRQYSGVSYASLVLIVGAIVYFLMPTDFVPDFIVWLGLVDDGAVVAWVVRTVRDELAKHKAWEAEMRAAGIDDDGYDEAS